MADNQTDPDSAGKAGENPQNDVAPPNSNKVPKFGLLAYLGEIVLAGAVGTGIWVFGEHLTSHGHTTWGSILDFFAFCIYFATIPITAVKAWPRPLLIWPLFSFFCVVMACLFYISSLNRPQPITPVPRAHFEFSVIANGLKRIVLTNDFLIVHEFDKAHSVPGFLFVPMDPGDSNLALRVFVQNDSSAFAENVEITFMATTNMPCTLDNGWFGEQMFDDAWAASISGGVRQTNAIQSWKYIAPYSVLSGNGFEIPLVRLSSSQIGEWNGAISLMARAKDSPTSEVFFGIWTMPKSLFSSNDFTIPFVAALPLTNFSEAELKELQQ